jgi:NADPH-dependent 2,4-dienoyl-CoA reductase/sulfur reductase-like enzyme/nitrite reductase/ring-hydroxylating ferredoxin subunit
MAAPPKPNFAEGISIAALAEGGMLVGDVGGEDVLLARHGEEIFAIGASCTHYHGALAQGLMVGDTVRCPLHHACFSLRTGALLRNPALDPVDRWRVERSGDRIVVREKLTAASPAPEHAVRGTLQSVVIVGGGAAGLAAAAALRRQGYENGLTLVSADDVAPYDRPNLSKDFLAGTAPAEWMPLRTDSYYADNHIELILEAAVGSLELPQKRIVLENGRVIGFDALLLATGSSPVRLPLPGATADNVRYLRSMADGRDLLARAEAARQVVVLGMSFIGLEVAASLRMRGLEVHVVGRERMPMEHTLGTEVGALLREVHTAHGVQFHFGTTVQGIEGRRFTLSDGTVLEADFMVAGVGVRPNVELAQHAGLAIDRGVVVDQYLETAASGVFAAGDIARWPAYPSRQPIRVEHWVVAERQGAAVARNLLGHRESFDAVPFFWSQHYDLTLNYVGHAERWDSVSIEGELAKRDCLIRYRLANRTLAVATLSRDRESLQAELALENGKEP